MALVLLLVFGPPLRLLPLLIALGAAGFAFGLLSLLGGSLTMASVAVLPVVIGLAVDYAIQLQARFREAAAAGERPPAAAVVAAVRGGPVIATAALATAVGFLTLILSPIPMVREFAIALVAGIAAALAISLTAGLAALSMAPPAAPGPGRDRPAGPARRAARAGAAGELARAPPGGAAPGSPPRRGSTRRPRWERALAASIQQPGQGARRRRRARRDRLGGGDRDEGGQRHPRARARPTCRRSSRSTALQDATGVSQELDVLVSGDVTSPAAIAWMSDFKQRVLGRARLRAGRPRLPRRVGSSSARGRRCPTSST